MDGTGELFAPFLDAAEGQFKVQVVRYPTHLALGYAELLGLVRSALPVDEPYVILGESFSGPIAIWLAAEHHHHLKGVVLCSTFARNPRPALARIRHALAYVPFVWLPSIAMASLLLGTFGTAALRRALAQAVAQVSSAVLRQRLRAVLAVDVSVQLRSAQVPCLYLQASQDRLVPESAVAYIRSVLPEVEVVKIHAPHGLLQAAPAQAVGFLSSFIVKCEHYSNALGTKAL